MMVLGYTRLIWERFVVHQDLQTVLRCHSAALGRPMLLPSLTSSTNFERTRLVLMLKVVLRGAATFKPLARRASDRINC
jgi:hypothetical protein